MASAIWHVIWESKKNKCCELQKQASQFHFNSRQKKNAANFIKFVLSITKTTLAVSYSDCFDFSEEQNKNAKRRQLPKSGDAASFWFEKQKKNNAVNFQNKQHCLRISERLSVRFWCLCLFGPVMPCTPRFCVAVNI